MSDEAPEVVRLIAPARINGNPSEEELRALIGYEFPGGKYTIEHWENFLFTDCCASDPLPDGIVHPAALFHVPILGAQTSLKEMFVLGHTNPDHPALRIESYDWELIQPIYEEVPYTVSGGIPEAERLKRDDGGTYDRIVYAFELHDLEGEIAARADIVWQFDRPDA